MSIFLWHLDSSQKIKFVQKLTWLKKKAATEADIWNAQHLCCTLGLRLVLIRMRCHMKIGTRVQHLLRVVVSPWKPTLVNKSWKYWKDRCICRIPSIMIFTSHSLLEYELGDKTRSSLNKGWITCSALCFTSHATNNEWLSNASFGHQRAERYFLLLLHETPSYCSRSTFCCQIFDLALTFFKLLGLLYFTSKLPWKQWVSSTPSIFWSSFQWRRLFMKNVTKRFTS